MFGSVYGKSVAYLTTRDLTSLKGEFTKFVFFDMWCGPALALVTDANVERVAYV